MSPDTYVPAAQPYVRPRPKPGSYDPAHTTAGGLHGELARLEAQAALSFDEELDALRSLGVLRPDARVLVELGAGSGAVTQRLRAAYPGLRVEAVDHDPALAAHIPRDAKTAVTISDATRVPLPDRSADAVLLRYVLQHVPDPAPVLAEALRLLRPGGRIAVTEVDAGCWGMADPIYPELAYLHAALGEAQRRAGGDRDIGRRLTRMLRAAGFADVAMRPFAATTDRHPVEAFAAHLGPQRLEPLVASGVLTLRDVALAADRWNRFRADPDAWVMLLGFTAAGTAPDPSRDPSENTVNTLPDIPPTKGPDAP
ncbi:class I SAM-dependent methyltransferase [Yinghuangia seranimata]|uniref:class I SAM-dependent methyltransferase n=1 Tax=Yinghuangia seranimata TaxID=408067 RepID=UPI00248BAD27|nr:methyltransferase domain-containing protein [Yinghuangia seranimata]MDI2130067.1 methyltransferase domain-containing protein [Yinghuangia seranimata]